MNQIIGLFKDGRIDGGGDRIDTAIRIDDIKLIEAVTIETEQNMGQDFDCSKIYTKDGKEYISEECVAAFIDKINE